MDVREIQEALKKQGYDPGPIDGKPGRLTAAAVKAFQKDRGLKVDGIVGEQTANALSASTPVPATSSLRPPVPTWMAEAYSLLGTREIAGRASNKTILEWADNLDIHYPSDDVPWCGLFVAHCIGSALPGERLPENPLGARSWLQFGSSCTPTVGGVLVFWRESRNGWKGHVGFYRSEDDNSYHVLGGNQSDSVSIAIIAKNRLLDARWPNSVQKPSTGAVRDTVQGLRSTNEA